MVGKSVFNNLWLVKPEYKLWFQRKRDNVYSEMVLKSHLNDCGKLKKSVILKTPEEKVSKKYFADIKLEDLIELEARPLTSNSQPTASCRYIRSKERCSRC